MKIVKTNGNLEVKKSEFIVKARYKLNPLAIKFISTIIANLKRTDEYNQEYVFKVNEFKELTGQKTKRIYELLDEATEELLNNPLKIPLEDGGFFKANWIADAEYKKGSGIISFTISPKLRPFLIEAQQKYLKYRLENILPLKSGYSIRMYEILKDYYNTQSRYGNKVEKIIEVSKLREILEIPQSYQYSSHIKKHILEKSKQELKDHTDIIFDYEEIKTGRKVTHLKFIIQPNPKKLKEQEQKIKPYLKSFKTFTDYLRDKWAGNLKFFFAGIDPKTNKEVFFGINNKGLLYSTNGGEIIEYNAIESKEKYMKFYKVFKNSELWQDLLETQTNLIEIRNNDIEYYKLLMKEAKEILI
jgi:plasmid replication initiation protein